MPSKLPKAAAPSGRLIGYARVSTEEQGTDPQLDELLTAGCATVLEEHASGADRSRPVLARLLHEIRPGETLVVVRLDRLASSVSAASSHASLRQRRQGNLEARWQPAAGSSPLCPVLVLFTALDMDNT